jgi:hypothetical protein
MKTKLLISVATAALIAGTAGALAQQEEKGGAPAGAKPGAAQHEMAPGGAMHGPTPGAAQNQMKPQGGMSEQKSVQGNPSEERGKASAEQNQPGKPGVNAEEHAQTKPGAKTDEKAQTEERNKTQENAQTQDRNKENAQTQEKGGQQNTAAGKAEGGKSVQLSETQRTQIKGIVVKDRNVARADNVNFSINVGVAVPRTVHFAVLPADIVEVVPEYRGFDYVVVGEQLLIIDPNTMLIVEILPV